MIKDKFYLISPASLLVSEVEKSVIYVRVTGLYNFRVIRSQPLAGFRDTTPELQSYGRVGYRDYRVIQLQGYKVTTLAGFRDTTPELQSYGRVGYRDYRVIQLQGYKVTTLAMFRDTTPELQSYGRVGYRDYRVIQLQRYISEPCKGCDLITLELYNPVIPVTHAPITL